MKDFTDLIKYFYTHFVLRDFLSKILPGFILINTLYNIHFHYSNYLITLIEKQSFMSWLFIIGFAWIIGFAIQRIGLILGSIPIIGIVGIIEDIESNEFDNDQLDKNYKIQFGFEKITYELQKIEEKENKIPMNEWYESQRLVLERLDVIMEATGNTAIALMISIVYFTVEILLYKELYMVWEYLPIGILIFIIIIFLINANRDSCRRIYRLREYFRILNNKDKSAGPAR